MVAMRKSKKIGTKISGLVAVMFIVSLAAVIVLCVSMFRGLVMDMLRSDCVNGTNLLAYELAGERSEGRDLDRMLDDLKAQTGCEFTIFEGNTRANTTIIQDGERAVGTALSAELTTKVLEKGESFVGETSILGVPHICSYVPTRDAQGQINGLIFSGVSSSEATAHLNNTILLTCGLSVAFLAAVLALLYFYIRRLISVPLDKLTSFAQTIEQGNLGLRDGRILSADIRSEDEIGALAAAFEGTMERMKGYIGEISQVLSAIAGNDLTLDPELEYVGDFASIRDSLSDINNKLNHTMHQVIEASEQVSTGSDHVSSGAQVLAQGATEQAAAVEELAATIQEVSGHIQLNAESALQTSGRVREIGGQVTESNDQMQKMMQAMANISKCSDEIGKIIKTIKEIASQTNLLSLNAAVEAARAGAAGKGFAVVADEVRSLAAKSADASQNTSELIENTLRTVAEGSKIANETALSLGAVVKGTKEITEGMNEIARASKEQAEFIKQISEGVDQISSVVQTNSATAEESASASEEMLQQVHALKNLVGGFNLKR